MSLVDATDDYIGYSPEGSQYLHDICAAMIGMVPVWQSRGLLAICGIGARRDRRAA